jgi:hypothetical protein
MTASTHESGGEDERGNTKQGHFGAYEIHMQRRQAGRMVQATTVLCLRIREAPQEASRDKANSKFQKFKF